LNSRWLLLTVSGLPVQRWWWSGISSTSAKSLQLAMHRQMSLLLLPATHKQPFLELEERPNLPFPS
jgi:hypothetical protein